MKKILLGMSICVLVLTACGKKEVAEAIKESTETTVSESTSAESTIESTAFDELAIGGAFFEEHYNDVGDVLANFEVETNKGTTFELNKVEKPVFIYYWTTWAGPCVVEMEYIQELYEEYKDRVEFVMINEGETKEVINDFLIANDGKFTFPIGFDEERAFTYRYNLYGYPTAFVVGKDKIVKENYIGARSKEEYKTALENTLK